MKKETELAQARARLAALRELARFYHDQGAFGDCQDAVDEGRKLKQEWKQKGVEL